MFSSYLKCVSHFLPRLLTDMFAVFVFSYMGSMHQCTLKAQPPAPKISKEPLLGNSCQPTSAITNLDTGLSAGGSVPHASAFRIQWKEQAVQSTIKANIVKQMTFTLSRNIPTHKFIQKHIMQLLTCDLLCNLSMWLEYYFSV